MREESNSLRKKNHFFPSPVQRKRESQTNENVFSPWISINITALNLEDVAPKCDGHKNEGKEGNRRKRCSAQTIIRVHVRRASRTIDAKWQRSEINVTVTGQENKKI